MPLSRPTTVSADPTTPREVQSAVEARRHVTAVELADVAASMVPSVRSSKDTYTPTYSGTDGLPACSADASSDAIRDGVSDERTGGGDDAIAGDGADGDAEEEAQEEAEEEADRATARVAHKTTAESRYVYGYD
jgi:hypothetical protein